MQVSTLVRNEIMELTACCDKRYACEVQHAAYAAHSCSACVMDAQLLGVTNSPTLSRYAETFRSVHPGPGFSRLRYTDSSEFEQSSFFMISHVLMLQTLSAQLRPRLTTQISCMSGVSTLLVTLFEAMIEVFFPPHRAPPSWKQ